MLKRCDELKQFYAEPRSLLYAKSEMPLTYDKVGEFVARRDYWSRAEEYSMLLNDLERVMWEHVRLAADPVRPKKKVHASEKKDEEPQPPI